MIRPAFYPERGSLLLVVMCFVAVLGIGLTSYLALSARAMTIGNRSVQTNLTKQLAESAIDEALRAFNKNDWSDWSNGIAVDWTLDTTNRRATAALTFPSSKFGQGVTASAKIRIDNYDSPQLNAAWGSSVNYRVNDVVGYGGLWYRCVQNHSNQTPSPLANLAYWVPAPIPWAWCSNYSYKLYDVVNYNGTWYRCTNAHTSTETWVGSNWSTIGSIKLYSPSEYHAVNDVVYNPDSTTWYRCTSAGTPGGFSAVAQISWQYSSGTTYMFNDVVCYYTGGSYNWYRCKVASSLNVLPTNTTNWENALSGSWSWASTTAYSLGDVVYRSGSFYRCVRAHTNQGPPNTTYWSASPPASLAWDSGRHYSQYDTVRYKGIWYLSLQNSNYGRNPITDTAYWASTNDSSYQWTSATNYSSGTYRSYGGVWYKAVAGSTGRSPNNTTYWTASWKQSWQANSSDVAGAPVVYAEGTITYADGSTSKTQLRAVAMPAPLFPNAVGSVDALTISGGGTIDSYDATSSDGYSSGSGSTVGFGATLASNYSSGTAITISSTAVKGYLAAPSSSSSPYAPLYSSGGSVKGASSAPSPNIDLSRISRSPYIPQFDIPAAIQHTTLPTTLPIVLNLGTPGAPTPSVYYDTSPTIGGTTTGTDDQININGPVILYVNGNLRVNTGDSININSGGSLTVYLTNSTNGRLRVESTSNGIINRSPSSSNPDPKNMVVLADTTSNVSQYYSYTTKPFFGIIYMPNTTTTTGLTIADGVEIYGALSAKKIVFSGAANLHYDTSLRYASLIGVDQPRVPTEVRELTDATELATMP